MATLELIFAIIGFVVLAWLHYYVFVVRPRRRRGQGL
jgi:hypothetical protein